MPQHLLTHHIYSFCISNKRHGIPRDSGSVSCSCIVWRLCFQLSSSIAWLCSSCPTLSSESTIAILQTRAKVEKTSKLLLTLHHLHQRLRVDELNEYQQRFNVIFFFKKWKQWGKNDDTDNLKTSFLLFNLSTWRVSFQLWGRWRWGRWPDGLFWATAHSRQLLS